MTDSRQKPLTKSRLFEILGRYAPGVVMEAKGGYDTGVWFSFKGVLLEPLPHGGRIVGGRIAGRHGFCSEALVATDAELRSRGGAAYGIGLFMARCATREARLARWLGEYGAMDVRNAAVAGDGPDLLSEDDGEAVERKALP